MNKFVIYIFLFLFSFSFGQKKFSINELPNIYPFSKASKVKIISYNTDFLSEFPIPLPPIEKDGDSTIIKKIIANQTFPIKLNNILGNENLKGIEQTKTLNFAETFELSKLLYNTCGKFPNEMREISNCFFPRNAILFYNDNDKVFEFLEICFECHRMEFTSKKSLEINGMCNEFYSKLENLFKKNGLKTQFNRNY